MVHMNDTAIRPEHAHDARLLELSRDLTKAITTYAYAKKSWEHATKRAEQTPSGYDAKYVLPGAAERYEAAKVAWAVARDALQDHEANYTGWNRYWLVTSSAGLIHARRSCHTCNKGRSNTEFALLPSMSGLDDHGLLVQTVGAALCSVCFPDAPTSWTDQVRLPTSLTLVLFESGEDAFRRALSVYQAKQAHKVKTACPGSGTNAPPREGPLRYRSDYRTCPHCGEKQPVTSTAKFRQHKGKK